MDDDDYESVRREAGAAMHRAWVRTAVLHAALAAVAVLAVAVLILVMFVLACTALFDLRGLLWWLALVYLLVVAAGAVFQSCRDITRALRREQPQGPPEWLPVLVELDQPDCWRMRVITAPLAVLAATHLAHLGMSEQLAVPAAILGWLGLDLTALITRPSRRRLNGALALHSTDPRTDPEH